MCETQTNSDPQLAMFAAPHANCAMCGEVKTVVMVRDRYETPFLLCYKDCYVGVRSLIVTLKRSSYLWRFNRGRIEFFMEEEVAKGKAIVGEQCFSGVWLPVDSLEEFLLKSGAK